MDNVAIIGDRIQLILCLYTNCGYSYSVSIPLAAVGATAVVSLLVGFIAGALSGTVATVCITRWNKSSKRASNMPEPQQTVPVYEEVGAQSQKIELKENVAYGPVKVD